MLKFSIVFEFMLSTNFDWKSESLKVWNLKVWKSESLKSEMLSDSKNYFFSSFFLDQAHNIFSS